MNALKCSTRLMVFLLAFSAMGCEFPSISEEPETPAEPVVETPAQPEEPAAVETVEQPVTEPVEEAGPAEETAETPEEPLEPVDDSAVMDALESAIEDRMKYARDEQGLNVVSEEGIVMNEEGEAAKTDVEPLSEGAPQQSNPIEDDSIPEESITLEISKDEGYVPNSFEVKPGQVVTLVIKSVDDKVHVFRFKDPSLNAVAVGVAGFETRAIKFNAPTKPGEYEYFSDVPGQKNKTGKMIVK